MTCLLIIVTFATLKDWGLGWMSVWWLWLLAFGLSGLAGLAVRSSSALDAGADWFRYGRSWVKTYQLTEIKLAKASGADDLELKDAGGQEISINILAIQNNPDLWNLIYNGILHSVHNGGAAANQRARERLHLDLDDPLPSGDEPA